MRIYLLLCILLNGSLAIGQSTEYAELKGTIINKESKEPIAFASIVISETQQSTLSRENGSFSLNLDFSKINEFTLMVNIIGFKDYSQNLIKSTLEKDLIIYLESESIIMEEVTVVGSSFKDIIGVPVSLKTTSAELISSNAGGGGDFAKLMQSLPGLTALNSFRNDLIVRGGGPTENTFFVDDIEIPYINHLATQGSTGGTISLLNVRTLQEVDFIASGYPANRPDAMSGVFNIYLKDPFLRKNISFGMDPTNVFLTGAGSRNNTAASFSVRKSYREFLLKQLGLAVIPSYTDYLLNLRHKINDNNLITFLVLGSYDDFTVNQDVNDSEVQKYLSENLPTNQQKSLTTGINLRNINDQRIINVKLSNSVFTNAAQKTNKINNQDVDILDFNSQENQLSAQIEVFHDYNTLQIKYGSSYKYTWADYFVKNQFYNSYGIRQIDYSSNIAYNLGSAFLQVSVDIIPSIFKLTLHNTLQLSDVRKDRIIGNLALPNVNGTIQLIPDAAFSFSVGSYGQLPENILLSYANEGELVNLNNTQFIKSFQIATGIELLKKNTNNQITIEGFYKDYNNYPFNTRDSISLANFGADFGVVGNVPISYTSEGRAYGLELFAKRSNTKKWNGWISYALSKSEFLDASGNFNPSTWDARHIVNAVISIQLKNNWSLSLNGKYQSALPYTSFDFINSSLVQVWDVNKIGIRDFSQLNQERGIASKLIDLRIGKNFKLKRSDIYIYLDLENILADADSQQALILDRDESGNPVIIPGASQNDPSRYLLKEIQNAEGVFIPSLGIEIDFGK